jgi:hypothetical protein
MEAVLEYNKKQSKIRKTDAVDKKISEIEYCDDIINTAAKIGIQVDQDKNITNLDIKKLGLQAVRVKHDITKDEPAPVVIVPVEEVEEDERKLLEEFGDYLARRKDDPENKKPE